MSLELGVELRSGNKLASLGCVLMNTDDKKLYVLTCRHFGEQIIHPNILQDGILRTESDIGDLALHEANIIEKENRLRLNKIHPYHIQKMRYINMTRCDFPTTSLIGIMPLKSFNDIIELIWNDNGGHLFVLGKHSVLCIPVSTEIDIQLYDWLGAQCLLLNIPTQPGDSGGSLIYRCSDSEVYLLGINSGRSEYNGEACTLFTPLSLLPSQFSVVLD